MRNTTAAGVESAPVLQSASAWVLSRLAVLPARGRMAIRIATATGITRRRPTIHPHRPIMHRGVAGIRITGATTPAESGIFGEAEPRWRRRGLFPLGSGCGGIPGTPLGTPVGGEFDAVVMRTQIRAAGRG